MRTNPTVFGGGAVLFVLWAVLQLSGYSLSAQEFDDLDRQLRNAYGAKFGFSVLVASDQDILFSKAYGYIDKLDSMKVDEETSFNVASITKTITALQVLRLVERGDIGLNDSIGSYWENVPLDKKSITVADLLAHTAGFRQDYVCEGIDSSDEALSALLDEKLRFKPGEGFGYSNDNYNLLALVVERVTGRRYEDVVRTEILEPAGMTSTYFWDEVDDRDNIAGKLDHEYEEPIHRDWGFIGSGGMYSTPVDLHRFWDGVRNHRLISEQNTELLFKSNYRTSSGIDIGFGWFVTDSTEWGCRELWTRGTESWGPNAVIRWFPDKNIVIIVCTNSGELGDKRETGNRIVSNHIADYLWK